MEKIFNVRKILLVENEERFYTVITFKKEYDPKYLEDVIGARKIELEGCWELYNLVEALKEKCEIDQVLEFDNKEIFNI